MKTVVRSRYFTFIENELYKNKLVVDSEFTKEQPARVKAVFDDITEDLTRNSESSNNVLVTPEIDVKKSSRDVRPSSRFSPSAYYMLLNEDGNLNVIQRQFRWMI